MIKRFEVSGYKNFKDKMVLDFSNTANYKFNNDCLMDGFIGKMIIYGRNSVGKTNFCKALCDITDGFTNYSNRSIDAPYDETYLNAEITHDYAKFVYVFQFGDNEVTYTYHRNQYLNLIYEKMMINSSVFFVYDHNNPSINDLEEVIKIAPTLNLEDLKIYSILEYIYNNIKVDKEHPLVKTYKFSQRMYGNTNAESFLSEKTPVNKTLLEEENLKEFKNLLRDAGISDDVVILDDNDGQKRLYFNTSPPLLFTKVASSGTKNLLLFFLFYKVIAKIEIPFFCIDEFDAFYHFELAEHILNLIKKLDKTQFIITSHNTNLLSNKLMRPDTAFILTGNTISSLADSTNRELREGHNLAKLYMSGEFDE